MELQNPQNLWSLVRAESSLWYVPSSKDVLACLVYSDLLFVHPPAISVASSKTCLLLQRLQSCHLENREHDRDLYEQCPKSRKLTGRFSFPFSCLRSECYLSRWDFLVSSLAPRQQSRRLLDMDVGRSPQQRID